MKFSVFSVNALKPNRILALLKQLNLLIIGGYGTFGGRLIQLLKANPRVRIYVAGRSISKATTFCNSQVGCSATLMPIAFDRDANFTSVLEALKLNIVIDASGPFQYYENLTTKNSNHYSIVQSCISLGINYLDLADSASFVLGITKYNIDAKTAGVFCLSGVSSFPVLTAAVTKHLATNFNSIESIAAGIAPSPYAGVGVNVIRAIASYAGQPVYLKSGGKSASIAGLTQSKRFTIAPPGKIPLRNVQFSLVDVPDLRLLSSKWPSATNVWMGAGTVPAILHKLLKILAWLVKFRFIPTLRPFAPIMHWVINNFRWGEHRGGMFVEIKGIDKNNQTRRLQWHLLAEGDDGPLIPCMALLIIVTKILNDSPPKTGARSAIEDVSLNEYENLFKSYKIHTGQREVTQHSQNTHIPMYQRILGIEWREIPSAIFRLHASPRPTTLKGVCAVRRGLNPLARVTATVFGLPKAGENQSISISFSGNSENPSIETWIRIIGKSKFVSHLSVGAHGQEHLLCEQVGPAKFYTALVTEPQDEVHLVLRQWKLLGIPMPMFLAPRVTAFEKDQLGKYHFFVEISHPLVGLIVRYQGNLVV
jgi:hypothetical protein